MLVDKRAEARSPGLCVVTDDGVVLVVDDCGPLTAQHTVVFLHGLCLTRASWARQIVYLSGRYGSAVRVLSYDHRGHGSSGRAPVSTYRIDRLGDDLAQVLAAAHVSGRVTLVGHSMGGMTALAYLGRRDRPVEPRGLVLVATTAGKLAERGLGRLLATPVTAALPELLGHTPDRLARAVARPVCATLEHWQRGSGPAPMAAVAARALTTTPVSTAVGFLSSLRRYDQHATLAGIGARTVVVSGGMDPLIPPIHGRELAAGIPGAQHVHLPRAGHMLLQEAPYVLSDAICRVMDIEGGQDASVADNGSVSGRQALPA